MRQTDNVAKISFDADHATKRTNKSTEKCSTNDIQSRSVEVTHE